ncbi:MAG: tRNA (guanosine(46)-N7)-methyltransferase TrmB [Candidatus Accumulibacter sp.]|uniref:tRNA (guanosine(46)-N7)-methyltransferase TrmB n=1 Tax=Accumulibacter sp. TaxID=2053492 RepID=UPI0025CE6845|nr:tRNA (guanosine(46)-N7)-methyltransferase TrmB [Accumulibacter sp.]MCP5247430.1 tRNA (guanosine(46)-N7)-methyltransferase TrmB [Accumulibacter sp.]
MGGQQADSAAVRAGHIRSFVRRQGRVSNAQQRYREAMMDSIGVPYAATRVDLDLLFGRAAPKILEIGFGMGETSAAIAAAHPENDYLGIEVHTPGVGSLCKLVAELGLSNQRIIQHDAVEVLREMIAPATLAGVHVFFPDPWPKKRHHKRRLLQPPLVGLLASRLQPDGYLHCATDWQDYAQQMLAVLSSEALLENAATDFAPRPSHRPQTRFEQRGLRLGHGVWDLLFRRRHDSLEAEDHRQDQLP